MKKTLALLLTILLTLSLLTGCSGKADPALTGAWQSTLDLSGPVKSLLESQELGALTEQLDLSGCIATLKLTFSEDCTYTFVFDAAVLQELMTRVNDLTEKLGNGTQVTLEKLLESAGLNIDGLSQILDKLFAGKELPKEITLSGSYKAEDGKLYLSLTKAPLFTESHFTYTADGSTLTLTGFGGGSDQVPENISSFFPYAFEKTN